MISSPSCLEVAGGKRQLRGADWDAPGAAGRTAGCLVRAMRGFTLVEIMIVIAVIAVAFAVGVPSFARIIRKEPMRQAVSDVLEALGQARAQSILRGVTMEFLLTGEGEMRVQPSVRRGMEPVAAGRLEAAASPAEEGEPAGRAAYSARLGEEIAVTLLELNFQPQMETTEVRVRFFPNGTCDDFTMVMESGPAMRKIWLDPITALADVEVLR